VPQFSGWGCFNICIGSEAPRCGQWGSQCRRATWGGTGRDLDRPRAVAAGRYPHAGVRMPGSFVLNRGLLGPRQNQKNMVDQIRDPGGPATDRLWPIL
jgi:hypothetical protein